MLKLGLIRRSCSGVYHLLPLALRSLEKLVALIDREMKAIGATKMAMPILTPGELWKKTGIERGVCSLLVKQSFVATSDRRLLS